NRLFKEYLADYRRKMIVAMKDAGIKPVPVKRVRGSRPDDGSQSTNLHFEWLALFQCKGLSFGMIADRYPLKRNGKLTGRDDSTVSKAVREAAKLAGLTLRRDRTVLK